MFERNHPCSCLCSWIRCFLFQLRASFLLYLISSVMFVGFADDNDGYVSAGGGGGGAAADDDDDDVTNNLE